MNILFLKKIDFLIGHISILCMKPIISLMSPLLKRSHKLTVERHLVVIKILGGGSLLIAMPALLSLRKRYPSQKFSLVCSHSVKAFAELMGVFDQIIVIDTKKPLSFLVSCLAAIRKLWKADAVLDLEIHSKLTTVFSALTFARNRIGFYMGANAWQKGVNTHLLYYNLTSPIYRSYNYVASTLGAPILSIETVKNEFILKNSLPKNKKSEKNQTVGLAPFCSELGREREFTPTEWTKFLSSSLDLQHVKTIIIFGGPGDSIRSNPLIKALEEQFKMLTIQNYVGKLNLLDSVKKMNELEELYTIDSGLNHVARLIGLKIQSFWGPTDPTTRLVPIPGLQEKIHYNKLFCSPCIHIVEPPPCKGKNICMKQHVDLKHTESDSEGWIVTASQSYD